MSIVTVPVSLDAIEAEMERRRPGPETWPVDKQVEHCITWIRSNLIIQDPALPNGQGPFDLYDYQEEFLERWLWEIDKARRGESAGARTEKSRQMGDSWLNMGFDVYALKFWRNFKSLVISRKQTKVDDGGQNSTSDSLLGKVRFMYEHLPPSESFPLAVKFMSLVNPVCGGMVMGEAATPSAGRGGTYLWGLWDETAATEHSWAILASWQQAVRCPHYLSTPMGKTNVFAFTRKAETLVHIQHHWTINPVKSAGAYRCPGNVKHKGQTGLCQGGEWRSPWYDAECGKLTPELIAQELDMSYERSVVGRAFPEFDASVHAVPDLDVEPGGVLVMSIDPGVTTAAANLIQYIDQPGVLEARVLAAWKGHDATSQTYAELFFEWKAKYAEGRGDGILVTGDPAGFARDLTYGKSVFGEMNTRHSVTVVPPPPGSSVGDRMRLIRDHMAGRTLSNGKTGAFAYRADLEGYAVDLESAKWPTDSDGRVTRDTDLDHNEAEHQADATGYNFAFYHGRSRAKPPTEHRGNRPATGGIMGRRW